MKPFIGPSVSMKAPDDWFDASTYIAIGPKIADGRPSFVVNIVRKAQEPDPTQHVTHQLPEFEKLPEFKLGNRTRAKVAGFETAILDYSWKQHSGPLLHQRQWYVYVKGDIYTLTATAPAEVFNTFAAKFDEMVQSFKPLHW
jgi:hypothetical protein